MPLNSHGAGVHEDPGIPGRRRSPIAAMNKSSHYSGTSALLSSCFASATPRWARSSNESEAAPS